MASDRVFIEDLRVAGRHGVHAHEKETAQDFLISIRIDVDTLSAARSDDLADTVDYSAVARVVREIVEGESYNLIERLASVIAERILEDARIERVRVSIRKPKALSPAISGVTIIREQQ